MTPEERKGVHWCSVHGAERCALVERLAFLWKQDTECGEHGAIATFGASEHDRTHLAGYSESGKRTQRQIRQAVEGREP